MRSTLGLAAALGLLAVACSTGSNAESGTSSSARTGASPSAPVTSQAADLRTHLDLLLAEQVIIVAKETAAAVNHSDEYGGYTALLTSNTTDLTEIMRSAFGDTSAQAFSRDWTVQNGFLVDYGIGVVTHNDAKAKDALTGLNGTAVLQLASVISDASGLPNDTVTQLLTQQANDDKTVIDDEGAQKYSSSYVDLTTAYFATARLGDALAARVAQKFSDRFPGDPTVPGVDRRVSLNLLLQEHAFLATMATDAIVASRDADKTAAIAALGINQTAISRSLRDMFGATGDFDKAWQARDDALVAYAQKGDADSKQAVTATVAATASAAHAPPAAVTNELNALIKVIDDQRGKASKVIAGDDRAAATSMQPVADAIGGL
jgi:hypothetical protein